jgi:hypothetical protein
MFKLFKKDKSKKQREKFKRQQKMIKIYVLLLEDPTSKRKNMTKHYHGFEKPQAKIMPKHSFILAGCTPRNLAMGLEWLQKAAENGNASASYNVGHMYGEGMGVPKDYKVAMRWFLKAAEQGSRPANNNIGIMYQDGLGVSKNVHTAVEWYLKTTNQDEKVAQYNLGRVYENDDEIKDIQIAIGWYKKAADNNDEKSKAALERLDNEGHYLDDQHGGNTSCYSFFSRYSCIKQTLNTRRITDQNRESIRQHSNPKAQSYLTGSVVRFNKR